MAAEDLDLLSTSWGPPKPLKISDTIIRSNVCRQEGSDLITRLTKLPLELVGEISRQCSPGSRASLALSCKLTAMMLTDCPEPLVKPVIPFKLYWKGEMALSNRDDDEMLWLAVGDEVFEREYYWCDIVFDLLIEWQPSPAAMDLTKFMKAVAPRDGSRILCNCCLELLPADEFLWDDASDWWQEFDSTIVGEQLLERWGYEAIQDWCSRTPNKLMGTCPPCACVMMEQIHKQELLDDEMDEDEGLAHVCSNCGECHGFPSGLIEHIMDQVVDDDGDEEWETDSEWDTEGDADLIWGS